MKKTILFSFIDFIVSFILMLITGVAFCTAILLIFKLATNAFCWIFNYFLK